MAETTDDVRRDIEMTRERISSTLTQLEQKTNVVQMVKDHPWPALAVAFGAGVLLSGSSADVKAAAATVTATRGATSRLGTVLDDVVANLMLGVTQAFHGHIDKLVTEVKEAIGAPAGGLNTVGNGVAHGFGDFNSTSTATAGGSMAGTSGLGAQPPMSGTAGASTPPMVGVRAD